MENDNILKLTDGQFESLKFKVKNSKLRKSCGLEG
jgi:isocitrate dehydrogenase